MDSHVSHMAIPWKPQGDQRGGSILHQKRTEGEGVLELACSLKGVDCDGGEVHLQSVADLREHHSHQRGVLKVEGGANLVALRVISLVKPRILDEIILQWLEEQCFEGFQVTNLLPSDGICPAWEQ